MHSCFEKSSIEDALSLLIRNVFFTGILFLQLFLDNANQTAHCFCVTVSKYWHFIDSWHGTFTNVHTASDFIGKSLCRTQVLTLNESELL